MVNNRRITGKKNAKSLRGESDKGPAASPSQHAKQGIEEPQIHSSARRHGAKWWQMSPVEGGTLLVLFLTFLAGAGVTWKTADLVTATNTAIQDARDNASRQAEDTQAALKVARDQAIAATAQASAMLEQLDQVKNTERPYVYLSSVTWDPNNLPNDPLPKIDFGFMNVGRNPTIIRYVVAKCYITDRTPPEHVQFAPDELQSMNNAMAAGAVLDVNTAGLGLQACQPSAPVSEADYADIQAGRKNLVFQGFIVYDGIFGERYTRRFASVWGSHPKHPGDILFHDLIGPGDGYNAEAEAPPKSN